MLTRAEHESIKYTQMWAVEQYDAFSPGRNYALMFSSQIAFDQKFLPVIDVGCGTGKGGKALRELGFEDLSFMDIVEVTDETPFIHQSIWKPYPAFYNFAYCCDVMEHLPTEYTGLALYHMSQSCQQGFLSIGLTEDSFGRQIEETLHLTVKPFEWWRDFLKEFGDVKEARDLGNTGVYHVKF